jgi:yecA family protein
MVNEGALTAQPILQDFVYLIKRHRDAMAHTLQSGDVFMPLLLADEHGVSRGNDWATGFLRGMELRKKDWAPLVDDDENGGSLVPIFALAYEHDPDPEMRSYEKPISVERCMRPTQYPKYLGTINTSSGTKVISISAAIITPTTGITEMLHLPIDSPLIADTM